MARPDPSDPFRNPVAHLGGGTGLASLRAEVFGDDADRFLKLDTKDVGDDYGSKEKDEMDFSDDENEEDIEEGDDDFGDDGGE